MASTLEEAGLTYNPFSTTNIWGNESPLHLKPVSERQVPHLGNDASALPRLATDPRLQMDLHQGSGPAPKKDQTRLQYRQAQEHMKTALLVGVLAVAFLWQRS